jgi:hypothetical protein
MSTELLNREGAASDLLATGAPARLIDGDLFFVVRPPLDLATWAEAKCLAPFRGMRRRGADPLAPVEGWAEAVVKTIRDHHDYPGEDVFFALMENAA